MQKDRADEPPASFHRLAAAIEPLLLTQQAFSRFVQDNPVFVNACMKKRTNRLGGILSLEPSQAKSTRRTLIWIRIG